MFLILVKAGLKEKKGYAETIINNAGHFTHHPLAPSLVELVIEALTRKITDIPTYYIIYNILSTQKLKMQ